jgi:hypothetical protein
MRLQERFDGDGPIDSQEECALWEGHIAVALAELLLGSVVQVTKALLPLDAIAAGLVVLGRYPWVAGRTVSRA